MSFIVPEEIERYAKDHTGPLPEIYAELARETHEQTDLPQMQVGPLEGRLLKLLAQLTGARRAVEIGTFTGYSALSIAEGMADDGKLYTCDIDEQTTEIARRYFERAPWGDRIELRLGPAIDTLAELEGPFDLAFVDADKSSYIAYWDALLPKMRSGALVVVDNVLWGGSVLSPHKDSDRAIVAFNRHAAADERVERSLLTIRDGMLVARVR